MPVHDLDRPDVGGVPPKMLAIKELVAKELAGLLPHLAFGCTDNIMSSVTIRGAKQPKEQWSNGIFENATYVLAQIIPSDGKRYYDPADGKVTVEVLSTGSGVPKFRKYTATPEKAVAKFKQWLLTWNGTPANPA